LIKEIIKKRNKLIISSVYLCYQSFKICKMNISFFTQSNKELVNIYIRLRDTNIYAQTSTNIKINSNNFKKGAIKLNTIPKNSSAEVPFLRYVGKKGVQNSLQLSKRIREVKENLKRIKEQQNKSKVIEITA